jgi:thioredoxin-related protein
MNNKTLLTIAVTITVLVAAFIITDQLHKGIFGSRDNWQWSDQWGNGSNIPNQQPNQKPNPKPDFKPDPKPETEKPKTQITTNSYTEALRLSADKNMKVVLFFHASWCKWCKKMTQESFSDDKVKELLKNYILADIDTDSNREVASKYKVAGIPALFMIDSKGSIIQQDNYMDAKKFADWLDVKKW